MHAGNRHGAFVRKVSMAIARFGFEHFKRCDLRPVVPYLIEMSTMRA
jgi:hypothetical protein